jgi:hypothetical protein
MAGATQEDPAVVLHGSNVKKKTPFQNAKTTRQLQEHDKNLTI